MIEKIMGIEKMTLPQCEELAKDVGFNSATFDLVGPKGRFKAKWLDAYMGLFELEGQKGFIRAKDLMFATDLWCENLMPGVEK